MRNHMAIKIAGYTVGILNLVYFGLYAALTGLTNKFTYFWLLLGLFFILLTAGQKGLRRVLKAAPTLVKAVAGAIIGLGILTLVIAEFFIIGYGSGAPQPGADYVIVLGAQVRGRTPTYNLARRLDAAYQYLEENPTAQVILSGGQGEGEDISEARAMAEYLSEKGIATERMILEEESRNTHENLQYSREKMDTDDASVVLVTNSFHVFRSVGIAKKQGLKDVTGLGAPVMWYTVPNMYLREAFAVVKYKLFGQI